MLKKISALACLVLIITITSAVVLTNGQEIKHLDIPKVGNEVPKVVYKNNISNKKEYTSAKFYKFKSPKEPLKEATVLATKLGIKGNLTDFSDMKTYSCFSKDGTFEYWYDSGKWSYTSQEVDSIKGGNVPNKNEAIKIAKNYLESIGVEIPDRFKQNVVVSETTSGDNLKGDYRILSRNVYFYPVIDGKPVYGVSRLTISVGVDGKILRVEKFYKDFEEDSEYPIINADEALQKLNSDEASVNIDTNAQEAEIIDIDVNYWEDAGGVSEQPHLQPVWVIKGKSKNNRGEEKNFDAIIPALKN